VVSPESGAQPDGLCSASVNLPIKSRSSLLAPAHPGGPGNKGRKTVMVLWYVYNISVQTVMNDAGYVFSFCLNPSFVSRVECLEIIMVALCNRADHYIFMLWFVLFLLSFFFFPRLISAVGDWMSTILRHMVWS